MGILAECPICHSKQSLKKKACKCGENLDRAKTSKRVKYWINYRLPDGKQVRQSVDSFEGLNGYSMEDARKASAKISVHKAENRLLDVKKEDRMTFNQLASWYLNLDKVKGLKSCWRIKLSLDQFNSAFGDRLVSSVKPLDLENYQAQRKAAGKADATIDQEIGSIKSAVYKAVDNEILSGEIYRRFKRVKKMLKAGSNKKDEVFTVQEAYDLIENCNPDLKPMVIMAYHTGMRRGEIFNLKRSRLNIKEGLIKLRAEDTKNSYPRVIPISKGLMSTLKSLKPMLDSEYVFPKANGKAFKNLKSSFKDACIKAGITYGRDIDEGKTFHSLRHTFNTDMDEAGISRSVIDAIRGEADNNSMFNRYNTVKLERLIQAIDRLEEYREGILNVDQSVDQAANYEK
jgi:integrase